MKLTSPSFENAMPIPAHYTCDGENVNPPLSWNEVPDDVQRFALVVDDPDSPVKVWTHWIVWNIPTEATGIAENSVPIGALQGRNDFGDIKYGGPCPGSGNHRYRFKLYALDAPLDLAEGVTQIQLEEAMADHKLAQAELIGTYQRN